MTAANGQVAYQEATPFIPANTGTLLSDGVVKAPDASLGFEGVFVPTAISIGGTLESIFPAADNPAVSLIGYSGNLGMNSAQSQSVYQLDTTGLTKISGSPHLLHPGQTWTLAGGKGSITFVGVKQWVSLAITYDPGQVPALVCGILALAGLLISFFVRRRRVFVRAVPAPQAAARSSPSAASPGPTPAAGSRKSSPSWRPRSTSRPGSAPVICRRHQPAGRSPRAERPGTLSHRRLRQALPPDRPDQDAEPGRQSEPGA